MNSPPERPLKICLAGEGAIARKHMAALTRIDGVEVVSLAGGVAEDTAAFAADWNIPHSSLDLAECIAQEGVQAVILATPTPLHAKQAEQVLQAGKHVLVEIPMASSLAESERLLRVQKETGLIAMVCHTRRFNPSHQWIHNRILSGDLTLQHMVAETFFFRRENINALGKKRNWTDHLLWHHACHTVDLFQFQSGDIPAIDTWAQQGPIHPELGIAMDMTIGLKAETGALCTLSLSFNNEGPFGTFFRYICDKGTYIARYDDLTDGQGNQIDLSEIDSCLDGIEIQDREFFNAVREGREPRSSFKQALSAMKTLARLEKSLNQSLT